MAIKDMIPWNWGEEKVPVKREERQAPSYQMQRSIDAMNSIFDDFFSGPSLLPYTAFSQQFGAFQPQIDVSEDDDTITVSAELAGISKDDIEVSLSNNALTISGEKHEEKENKSKDFYHVERSYGSFRRSIPLPCKVEADEIDATFKNGVLNITFPKSAEVREHTKKIAIKRD